MNKIVANLRNKRGFTLAEILVTLGIIGVLASMTIPNLVQDIQDAQLKTAWKKTFADLSQATKRVMIDNGGTFKGICADNDNDCLKNKFVPYLNYVKSCSNSATNGTNQCIYNLTASLKRFSGSTHGATWTVSSLVLNNGMVIMFGDADNACNLSYNNSNISFCGWFFVDVNGSAKPNTVGKDFYHGWILPDRIIPVGAMDQNNTLATWYNSSSCSTSNATAQGWGCSAQYLYQ